MTCKTSLRSWSESVNNEEAQYEILVPIIKNLINDGILSVVDSKYEADLSKLSQKLSDDHIDLRRTYKANVNIAFRGVGGSTPGFPNLRGREAEFDGALWRFHKEYVALKASNLGSPHLAGNRSPVGGSRGEEWFQRLSYLLKLLNGRSVETAVPEVCMFEFNRQHKSRVVAKKSSSSKSTQDNVLDRLTKLAISNAPDHLLKYLKENKFIVRGEPANALSLAVCVYASGMQERFKLYKNTTGELGEPVSLLEYLKKTCGEDREVFKEMTGFEFPFLTDACVEKIIDLAQSHISPEDVNLIKESISLEG